MAKLAGKGLEETFLQLNTNQEKHSDMAIQIEEALNSLDRKITSYLVDISTALLCEKGNRQTN